MNHVLLGSAGGGLGVLQLLRYPRSAAGFTAQGKMVGLTGERLRPPPLSASRGRRGLGLHSAQSLPALLPESGMELH